MHGRSVFIHRLGRLRTPVTPRALENQRGNSVLAGNAFKRGAAVYRLGRVVSHFSIVALAPAPSSGKRCVAK